MALEKPDSLGCFKQRGKWKNLFLCLKFQPADPDGKINNPPTHTQICKLLWEHICLNQICLDYKEKYMNHVLQRIIFLCSFSMLLFL